MDQFISCDWGTSAFRLRLVEAKTKKVLAEVKTETGIAAKYQAWEESGGNDRISFYRNLLAEQMKALESQCQTAFDNMTIVMSGMVSSSIGMIELPYKELPVLANGSDILTHVISPSQALPNKMILISGVRTNNDVMRGEETKLIGCEIRKDGKQLIIMPGTHCKHIEVDNSMLTHFETFMTGEMFSLLRTKSILASSVEENKKEPSAEDVNSFAKGVEEGAASNLLNSIFHVRTNRLFEYCSAQENYHYMSGLLIGAELKDVAKNNGTQIMLIANKTFSFYYTQALQILGITNYTLLDADEALIAGQCKIFMQQ